MADSTNPYFATDFPAYYQNLKWVDEQNFANQQAWDARLYATHEREQAQAWNEEMWNMTNEYNSIGSQIDRAREAGVNPSAIVGGDYMTPQATPLTTSPQPPVQASTPSSNAKNRVSNSASTLVDSAKGFAENLISAKQVQLNQRQIDSQVKLNLTNMQKLASDAGVANATEQQIRQSVSWIDNLNYATVMEKIANVQEVQNDFQVSLMKLLIDNKLVDSDIEVNEQEIKTGQALETKYKSEANINDIEAKYLDKIRTNEVTMQGYQVLDLKRRELTARILGLPLGTSEYEFNLTLAKKGLLKPYIEKVVVPNARAKMSPKETRRVTQHRTGLDLGILGFWGGEYTDVSNEPIAPYGYMTENP